MNRIELNTIFREYVRNNLTPTKRERNFISILYKEICNLLGNNCIQIGSYPRYTAIRPLHDLDVLFIIGEDKPQNRNPSEVLRILRQKIDSDFNNPTEYAYDVEVQTHSVTICFHQNNNEIFSIDIAPALISGLKNEFDDDIYLVPEIVNVVHEARKRYYSEMLFSKKEMTWIKSDPKGYINIAANANNINPDFRKSVKFIKKWNDNCKQLNESFGLKSFHIEQTLTGFFKEHNELDIFGAIFKFFSEIEKLFQPHIQDRADSQRLIDLYISDLTNDQRNLIKQARDEFMRKLEAFDTHTSVNDLIAGGFYVRKCSKEEYLFDYKIPVLIDTSLLLRIDGHLIKKHGFRTYWLSEKKGQVGKYREIIFSIIKDNTNADHYKWKVKNSDDCDEPRGEITNGHTGRVPESTLYPGNHYVECYAIKNNICICKARQNVAITDYN